MATVQVKQGLHVDGVQQTLAAFAELEKGASVELRKAAQAIASDTASHARAEGAGMGGVQALAANSIRGTRDRVPKIVAGGAKRAGSRRNPVGAYFFGAEFGGGARATTKQFPRHRGQHGYFLWPTIRERKAHDLTRYNNAAKYLCAKWAQGGGWHGG